MDIEKLLKNIEKNRMQGFYVKNKQETLELIKKLAPVGSTVGIGGSVTAHEIGLMDYLHSGAYNFLDRGKPGITPEEIDKVYRDMYFADTFFTSTNAITEDGYLYNVDGNSNRVSMMLYGPRQVIVIAGVNKIVKNLDEAARRVKEIAAPKNCVRLNCDTPCGKSGKCISLGKDDPEYADGCGTSARICCNYVIMGPQRVQNRVKIIIVDEDLGY